MRKDAYTYKGVTYKATKKDVAQKAIQSNFKLRYFLVGSNVNQSHFHTGWFLATHPQSVEGILKERDGMDTDIPHAIKNLYNSFNFYLESELGRYPMYYVEQPMKLYNYLIRYNFGTFAGQPSNKELRTDNALKLATVAVKHVDALLYKRQLTGTKFDYSDKDGVKWVEV